jgi:hypothetical protein
MEPTASQLIIFYRRKAQEYEAMARSLEDAVKGWSSKNLAELNEARVFYGGGESVPVVEPTAEGIKKLLRKKGHRVADLAKVFGATHESIRTIIRDPDNGLRVGLRGWVHIQRQQPQSFSNGGTAGTD